MLILSLLETEVLVLSRGFILCGGGVWTVPFSSFLPVFNTFNTWVNCENVLVEGRRAGCGIRVSNRLV